MAIVLYIHGMGGGGDSRIPAVLNGILGCKGVDVRVYTYDFDPDIAARQIAGWVDELKPQLIIGESLGAVHAIRIKGIPHLLISPALNAPVYFHLLSWLTLLPGMSARMAEKYKPREGDRQKLDFRFRILWKYGRHRREALKNSPRKGSKDYFWAFIGTSDHYLKDGIVSIRTWKKHFGDSFTLYDGCHFTEEEHIEKIIAPKILELLNISK